VRPARPSAPGRNVAVALVIAASASVAPRARADSSEPDPYAVPAAPRPPTLPELTHSETEGTLEATAGAILPNSGQGGGFTHAYVQRLNVEVPVGLRRWYVGAEYELAAADGRAVSGNLEIGGRTLWATRTGLAFGGGLSLVVPTAVFDTNGAAANTALDAASLRPWDVSFFTPSSLGAHPFIDVRAVDGKFVAQFRQALDVLDTGGQLAIYATVGLYLGLWATAHVAAGLEAFEAYAISVEKDGKPIDDGSRAAVVVSPNVRLVLPWVEPAISAFTNIGTPLQGASNRIWGFKFAFTLVYDPSRALGVRTRGDTPPATSFTSPASMVPVGSGP
jgi:hypothetical protein